MTIEIKRTAGKWLVNGKPYHKISGEEKTFFDNFIAAMKENFNTTKNTKS